MYFIALGPILTLWPFKPAKTRPKVRPTKKSTLIELPRISMSNQEGPPPSFWLQLQSFDFDPRKMLLVEHEGKVYNINPR